MSKRILIVDDESVVRDSIKLALGFQAYEVSLAKDSSQALDLCAEDQFDLIISDIRMPGMTGLQMVEQMHVKKPGQQFVVMSADPSDNEVEWLSEKNIPLLKKPFAVQVLYAIVARAIASRPE